MTDEEKKAIYDIKRELTDEDRREYMNKWFADDLQILVNLIEKQSNLIEKQSKEIKELKKKPIFLIKDIYSPKLKEISLQDVEGLIEQGRKEIKDKIKAKDVEGLIEQGREEIKDKIKAKIEEINKEMLNEENSLELFYRKKYCKIVLQSLLEKE